ncbi:alpha/beta hydrolase [Catenulispora subtropica]|uniref:Alpha/beta hydrolase n=1 Tax=Catenulispora subtropica TaxID=450798 RepID=A0ABN2QJ09_9ACTN
MRYVVIPGIGGSGPEHWQTLWENAWGARASRVRPASWDEPDLDDWCEALTRAVARSGPDVVLVGHSLGCLAAAVWLSRETRPSIRGAFLVAPPAVDAPSFPAAEAGSFIPVEPAPLTAPALVVSSDDDPYCDPESARRLAAAWHAGHVTVGRAGHINAASGLGAWPAGRKLLDAFLAG